MKNQAKFNLASYMSFIFLVLLCSPSCAPVFSELQSARTVGQNRAEFTPMYSSTSFGEDGESNGIQDHIGMHVAYGVTEEIDIRARIERLWLKDGSFSDGVSIIALGPKISLVENQIAFSLPIGRALGENTNDSWQLQPSLLFSAQAITDKLEFTVAPKYVVQACKGCENLVAVNFGFAISDNLNTWAIRPEYGLIYNPNETGHYAHFSVGVSAAIGGQHLKNKPIIKD